MAAQLRALRCRLADDSARNHNLSPDAAGVFQGGGDAQAHAHGPVKVAPVEVESGRGGVLGKLGAGGQGGCYVASDGHTLGRGVVL